MSTLETDLNYIHSDDLIKIGSLRGIAVYQINRAQVEQREAKYRAENISIGSHVNEGD